MYLWHRYASGRWLARNEHRLKEIAPGRVASISRPGKQRILVQVACRRKSEAMQLVRQFKGSAQALPRDWAKRLLRAHTGPPLRVGKRLLVAARKPSERQLVIPAAGAFGTGDHATTAMCLRLMEEETRGLGGDWKLLDLGTGSGILALAAGRFGARSVLGLDNDPHAIAIARENARLNMISGARFVVADVQKWRPQTHYDLITANLFAELLIEALPLLKRSLRPGGSVILSGILRYQLAAIQRSLGQAGLALKQIRRRGKWIALQGRLRRRRR